MIYTFPGRDEPIRQGDIFRCVPRVNLALTELHVVREDERTEALSWDALAGEQASVTALVALTPVPAIVATQDCDAQHSPDITLCQIRPFADIEGSIRNVTSTERLVKAITQQARKDLKWFYLPPSPSLGFTARMAVDFRVALCVPRTDLERLIHLRCGRLDDAAYQHFRERLAHFFRRYPYDEWYPLDAQEMAFYAHKMHKGEDLYWYPYQKASPPGE